MSRNRYAVILLVVLALTLWLAGRYVNRTTATLCNELQTACTLAETGQMPQAQQAYRAAADNAAQATASSGGMPNPSYRVGNKNARQLAIRLLASPSLT